jgi:hypothetical protein
VIAAFSSRGPNTFDPNLMKPDLSAPGVNILAGVTPELSQAQKAQVIDGTLVPPPAWNFYDGTSMATPHVAGIAALLHQQHPTWTPAAIKSALMTTGISTFSDGRTDDLAGMTPWGQGAGNVLPTKAADPGLVYDATVTDYTKYMCGEGVTSQCALGTIPGYALNMPSITLNNVLGSQTVSRTVTNVGSASATYSATASITGYSATVSPASFTVAPGKTQTYSVTLTRGNAANNVWQYGSVTLTDGTHNVRIPLQARSGQAVVAPAQISATTLSAARLVTVSTGFAGKMTAATGGLKPVTRTALTVGQMAEGGEDSLAAAAATCNAAATGVNIVPFSFPANTVAARFETFDRDTEGSQDLDLVLLKDNAIVAYSLNEGSNEAITLASPPAGDYKLCVIGYAIANGVSADYTLSSAVVSRADTGTVKVSLPSKVYSASTASVGVSWSGLAAGTRYLGGVQLLDLNGATAATTLLNVETNNPVPVPEAVARTKTIDRGI